MGNWMDSAWTTQLGWVLLHSVWQFSLVAFLVAACRSQFRSSATQRHRLACGGLVLIAALPAITWWKLATSFSRPPTVWSISPQVSEWAEWQFSLISFTWLIGIALFSIRPIAGWWTQRQISRLTTMEIPAGMAVAFTRASKRLSIQQNVQLKLVSGDFGPMIAGWLRPIIVVPASLLSNLSPQELELLLAHELAHVRRQDFLINTFQVLVETIFFYHPAVWWLSREIRLSREYCCDDLAVSDHEHRLDYVRALLKLETQRSSRPALALAARDGNLLQRVRRLSADRNTDGSVSARLSFAMGMLVVAVPFALMIATPTVECPVAVSVADEPPTEPTVESSEVSSRSTPSIAEGTETSATKVTYAQRDLWRLTLKDCLAIAVDNHSGSIEKRDETDDTLRAIPIRNLVRDIEVAYWDLFLAHQQAVMLIAGRDRGSKTVDLATRMFNNGTGTLQELAQAQGLVARFQSQLTKSLEGSDDPDQYHRGLFAQERSLRELMGLALSDGRIVYPADDPSVAPVEFDLSKCARAALQTSPELRQTKSRIERHEGELVAAKSELSGTVADVWLDRYAPSENEHGTDAKFGDEITPPKLGARRELTRLRGVHLRLAREKSYLKELEKLLTDRLSDAIAKTETHYQLLQTNGQRCQASDQEVSALSMEYEKRHARINVMLQSQERNVNAQIAYRRSLAEYAKSKNYVDFLDGTLLAAVSIPPMSEAIQGTD